MIVKVFVGRLDTTISLSKSMPSVKLAARMDCVDLGNDFFLIKFSDNADYDKV